MTTKDKKTFDAAEVFAKAQTAFDALSKAEVPDKKKEKKDDDDEDEEDEEEEGMEKSQPLLFPEFSDVAGEALVKALGNEDDTPLSEYHEDMHKLVKSFADASTEAGVDTRNELKLVKGLVVAQHETIQSLIKSFEDLSGEIPAAGSRSVRSTKKDVLQKGEAVDGEGGPMAKSEYVGIMGDLAAEGKIDAMDVVKADSGVPFKDFSTRTRRAVEKRRKELA